MIVFFFLKSRKKVKKKADFTREKHMFFLPGKMREVEKSFLSFIRAHSVATKFCSEKVRVASTRLDDIL